MAVSSAANPQTGLRLLALLDQALDLTQNAVEHAFIRHRIADLGP